MEKLTSTRKQNPKTCLFHKETWTNFICIIELFHPKITPPYALNLFFRDDIITVKVDRYIDDEDKQ